MNGSDTKKGRTKVHGLIREEGSFGANPGAKDLARHLYTRVWSTPVVIVADRPKVLLPSLRKQWLKLARKVQRERASTLDVVRVAELTRVIAKMHTTRFTTAWPPDEHPGDIYIVTIEQLLRWAPDFRTMYVTCDVEIEKLHIITALMPPGALVIIMNFN